MFYNGLVRIHKGGGPGKIGLKLNRTNFRSASFSFAIEIIISSFNFKMICLKGKKKRKKEVKISSMAFLTEYTLVLRKMTVYESKGTFSQK